MLIWAFTVYITLSRFSTDTAQRKVPAEHPIWYSRLKRKTAFASNFILFLSSHYKDVRTFPLHHLTTPPPHAPPPRLSLSLSVLAANLTSLESVRFRCCLLPFWSFYGLLQRNRNSGMWCNFFFTNLQKFWSVSPVIHKYNSLTLKIISRFLLVNFIFNDKKEKTHQAQFNES